MNMNTNPADMQFAEIQPAPKKRASKPKSPAWIEANLAAAEAHNANRWSFVKGTPDTIGESSRTLKAELRTIPARIAIGGCYLIFWGTAAAVAIGLFA